MMKVRFIGEGDRDRCTLQPLTENLLGTKLAGEYQHWSAIRLHGSGKGQKGLTAIGRKLLYASVKASGEGTNALVVLRDRDRDRDTKRRHELRDARKRHREQHAPIPTAIAQPQPHFEAWLLDDRKAVCEAFRLATDADIPTNVGHVDDPKAELDRLFNDSPRAHDGPDEGPDEGEDDGDVSIRTTVDDSALERKPPDRFKALADICKRIDPKRCTHAEQTGFAQFHRELDDEIARRLVGTPDPARG